MRRRTLPTADEYQEWSEAKVYIYVILIGTILVAATVLVTSLIITASKKSNPSVDLSKPISASQCVPADQEWQYFQGLPWPRVALQMIEGRLLLQTDDGNIIFPQSGSLHNHGIYISDIRGMPEEEAGVIKGDFRPGASVVLTQNSSDPYDPRAIAAASPGAPTAGYIDIQNTRHLRPRLEAGENLQAISLRGAGRGIYSQAPQILIAEAKLMHYLLRDVGSSLYSAPKMKKSHK